MFILVCYVFWSAMDFGVLRFENMCAVDVFFENIYVLYMQICTYVHALFEKILVHVLFQNIFVVQVC